MDEEDAKYSVAFPNLKQYRNLWKRLPRLVKDRTGITALFIKVMMDNINFNIKNKEQIESFINTNNLVSL